MLHYSFESKIGSKNNELIQFEIHIPAYANVNIVAYARDSLSVEFFGWYDHSLNILDGVKCLRSF